MFLDTAPMGSESHLEDHYVLREVGKGQGHDELVEVSS